MKNINTIYSILVKKYGLQNWWPTTLEKDLHPTYHGRTLNDKMRFEVVVGSILTQNTSWKNVEKAIIALNKGKLLSINGILKTPQKKLAAIIRSAGYFNQKAERLKIVASFFAKNGFKKLKKERIGKLRELLLALKGIGPETADSILLYAFEKPIFVIDAYTKRMCSYLGICKKDVSYDELQQMFMKKLKHNVKFFQEYHALIVAHAKNHYSKKPYHYSILK